MEKQRQIEITKNIFVPRSGIANQVPLLFIPRSGIVNQVSQSFTDSEFKILTA
jgi:hypothetical protein